MNNFRRKEIIYNPKTLQCESIQTNNVFTNGATFFCWNDVRERTLSQKDSQKLYNPEITNL
jgi:hypothetical protein